MIQVITIIVFSIYIFLFATSVHAKNNKIFLSDIDSFGEYYELQEFPQDMFEGENNRTIEQKGKSAGKKVGYYFVTKKHNLEKYPQNMMKAMAYFEVYYLQTLKEKEMSITRFKENNYNSNDISSLNTILSLNLFRLVVKVAVTITSAPAFIKSKWVLTTVLWYF